jgi:hypothetical protein
VGQKLGESPDGPGSADRDPEYRAGLRKSLGESTVTLIMSIMRGMFDEAMLPPVLQAHAGTCR